MGKVQRKFEGQWIDLEDFERLTTEDDSQDTETEPESFEEMSRSELYAMAQEVSEDVEYGTKAELIDVIKASQE